MSLINKTQTLAARAAKWRMVRAAACAAVLCAGAAAANAQSLEARMQAALANPQLKADMVARGQKLSTICANCHGANGDSRISSVPVMAGQNSAYLLEQMKKFADGRRRDPFMEGMIRAMNDEEKVSVVLFYVNQKPSAKPAQDSAKVAAGRSYYGKVCFRCHQTSGMGDSSQKIPRIAGQHKEYLVSSLTRYRKGSGERIDPQMAASVKMMTDADIDAVASYVSQMK